MMPSAHTWINVFGVVILLAVAAPTGHAESKKLPKDWNTARNSQFGFDFSFPAQWVQVIPLTLNSRAKIESPKGTPWAQCSFIVQKHPDGQIRSKAEVLSRLKQTTFTSDDWREALSANYSVGAIHRVAKSTLSGQPAYSAVVELGMRESTKIGRAYARYYITATSQYIWTIGCGGLGTNAVEAKNSFTYWDKTFQKIMSSVTFRY